MTITARITVFFYSVDIFEHLSFFIYIFAYFPAPVATSGGWLWQLWI
jgi:hypothetical protein